MCIASCCVLNLVLIMHSVLAHQCTQEDLVDKRTSAQAIVSDPPHTRLTDMEANRYET